MLQTKNGGAYSKTFQLSIKLAEQKKISLKNHLDVSKINPKSKNNYETISWGSIKCSKFICLKWRLVKASIERKVIKNKWTDEYVDLKINEW